MFKSTRKVLSIAASIALIGAMATSAPAAAAESGGGDSWRSSAAYSGGHAAALVGNGSWLVWIAPADEDAVEDDETYLSDVRDWAIWARPVTYGYGELLGPARLIGTAHNETDGVWQPAVFLAGDYVGYVSRYFEGDVGGVATESTVYSLQDATVVAADVYTGVTLDGLSESHLLYYSWSGNEQHFYVKNFSDDSTPQDMSILESGAGQTYLEIDEAVLTDNYLTFIDEDGVHDRNLFDTSYISTVASYTNGGAGAHNLFVGSGVYEWQTTDGAYCQVVHNFGSDEPQCWSSTDVPGTLLGAGGVFALLDVPMDEVAFNAIFPSTSMETDVVALPTPSLAIQPLRRAISVWWADMLRVAWIDANGNVQVSSEDSQPPLRVDVATATAVCEPAGAGSGPGSIQAVRIVLQGVGLPPEIASFDLLYGDDDDGGSGAELQGISADTARAFSVSADAAVTDGELTVGQTYWLLLRAHISDEEDAFYGALMPLVLAEGNCGDDSGGSEDLSGTPGTISGAVTDVDGNGIAGVDVGVYRADQSSDNEYDFNSAKTDAHGRYTTKRLIPGSYQVCFSPRAIATEAASSTAYVAVCAVDGGQAAWSGQFAPEIDATRYLVDNSTGQTGVDVTLPTGGSVSGKVSNDQTDGLGEVHVLAYAQHGLPGSMRGVAAWSVATQAFTGNDGSYTIRGLPRDRAVYLCFTTEMVADSYSPAGYVPDCYGGGRARFNSDELDVAGLTSIVFEDSETDRNGVDVTLSKGGAITGTVVGNLGSALRGAIVSAIDDNGSIYAHPTDTDGEFVVRGVPAGSYYLFIRGENVSSSDGSVSSYSPRWYPSAEGNDSDFSSGQMPACASKVTVVVGQQSVTQPIVLDGDSCPRVTEDPFEEWVASGDTAIFRADAIGTPVPTVQWQVSVDSGFNWTDVPGATVKTLTLTNVRLAQDEHLYRAKFTNASGSVGTNSVTTEAAKLYVSPGDTDAGGGSDSGGPDSGNTGSGNTGGSDGAPPPGSTPPVTIPAPVKSDPVVTNVQPGQSASSAAPNTKPSATAPVIVSLTSPVAGQISFTAVDAPAGTSVVDPSAQQATYSLLGRAFQIEAPPATASRPLAFDFAVDEASIPAGTDAADLTVFRDGIPVAACTNPNATTAAPDPCVVKTTTAGGVATIRVLSSHASTWTFGVKSGLVGNRIAGKNRYATSALIAEQFGVSSAVILANGTEEKGGADALSANYLAGLVSAPILLVQVDRVEAEVLTAVKKLLAGASNPTVYVLGGQDSVSDAVANQVAAAAKSVAKGTVAVDRIAGKDRYDTAALAAGKAGVVTNSITLGGTGGAAKTAIIASGQVNADALAAGALSYAWGIPVLLTTAGSLSDQAAAVLKAQRITQVIVLGGTDRVSAAVVAQAKAAGVANAHRVAGSNRFATAVQLYGLVVDTATNAAGAHYGVASSPLYLANGASGWADALSVGPLAGKNQALLLTTAGTVLSDPLATFLAGHRTNVDSVIGLGRGATVSGTVLVAASKALGQTA